jgi:TRAP-type mannitol/chloroaromatic compound transport system permease small subunit
MATGTGGRKIAPLHRLLRLIDGISVTLNAAGTLSLFGLMILINADVIGRGLLDSPVAGTPEITRIAIVAIVYLQLSHALHSGRLTRSDLLSRALSVRPRIAAGFEIVVAAAGFVFMAVLSLRFVPEITAAWSSGRFYGTRGGVTIPLWPLNLIIAIGLGATALQFAAAILRQAERFRRALGAEAA